MHYIRHKDRTMARYISNLRIVFFFLLITPYISAQQGRQSPQDISDRFARETFEKQSFPGMAVMVWKDGDIVFSKGYGYADIDKAIVIDPKVSKFRIGSISKPYTAAALGILYDRNKIYLDFPIQMYVPKFPKKKYDVTLRQLAGHLAGIRHYRGVEFMSNKHYPTVSEGLDIFKDDDLLHPPNSKYAYSSYGWNLISAAVENSANEDFLSFMQREVFDRCEMKNSGPDYATKEIANRVSFYVKSPTGDNQLAPAVDNSYKWAGGGFISSAEDVVLFAKAHLDNTLLLPSTLQLWTKGQTTSDGKNTKYGIGWRSDEDQKGRRWIGHSGGSVGGTSMMLIYPEEKLIVVTLVNLSSARMGNLAFRIANQFLGPK